MTVLPTLTDDERSVLLITREGGVIADIGDVSRWHAPINSLLKRGLLKQHDRFNNVITDAGIEAIEADQGALDGELKAAMTNFVQAKTVDGLEHVYTAPEGRSIKSFGFYRGGVIVILDDGTLDRVEIP